MNKKTIVITGSTRGIGYGLAVEFLKQGHQVVINGRNEDRLKETVTTLSETYQGIIGVAGSVDCAETHDLIIEKAIKKFSKIDIWINNAGIPQTHKNFDKISIDEIKAIIDINIYGLIIGTKVAANFMKQQGFGKIFNMEGFGSDGRIMKKLTLYGTTKQAVQYFSKSASAEYKNESVQIGILSPGMVRTDFLNHDKDLKTAEEIKRFEKVYRILAEEPEVVTAFLAKKVLASTKHYDRIKYLTKLRLTVKIIRLMFS